MQRGVQFLAKTVIWPAFFNQLVANLLFLEGFEVVEVGCNSLLVTNWSSDSDSSCLAYQNLCLSNGTFTCSLRSKRFQSSYSFFFFFALVQTFCLCNPTSLCFQTQCLQPSFLRICRKVSFLSSSPVVESKHPHSISGLNQITTTDVDVYFSPSCKMHDTSC